VAKDKQIKTYCQELNFINSNTLEEEALKKRSERYSYPEPY
jgi:hypothetical protein